MKYCLHIIFLAILWPCISWSQGFIVAGTELHDANGTNFIIKGVNVPLAWFVTEVNSNIVNIRKNTNANTLRIVVQTTTKDSDWQTCVQNCINNKMIPMVELHDVTGSNDVTKLQAMADWWASKASFLTQPAIARYILVNIANEWSDWYMASPTNDPPSTVWRDAYIAAIKTMRTAGIKTTIVVDGAGYGQDNKASTIITYGPAVESGDPEKNILFSVHMYCEWSVGGNSSITKDLPAIKAAGLPIIVGEFGWQENNGSSKCDIDESLIISTCQANGIGWLAWSWKGNGGGEEFLDLSTDWAGASLSAWGNTVVNGANGTKTAVTASVFNSVTATNDAEGSSAISLSPNPAFEKINIGIPDLPGQTSISIFNDLGVLFYSGIVYGSAEEVNLSTFPSGIYYIKLGNAEKTLTKKFVKK
jgi:mannan endo-1,4-beta-mannosidase